MPKEKFDKQHAFLGHTELLSFEEILRIARLAVKNGVEKLRLTGGEPLLRKGIEHLIADLSSASPRRSSRGYCDDDERFDSRQKSRGT